MDALLHSHAIRQDNTRRMTATARLHRLHADGIAPDPRRHGFLARMRMHPLPTLVTATSSAVVVAT
jgi:hypothetical protein